MARRGWPLVLLSPLCLFATAVRPARGSDSLSLRPRGWPPIHCELSTHYANSGDAQSDDSYVDFWMRGTLSRQFYRCRLDANDDARGKYLSASRSGYISITEKWRINLNRFRRAHWPANYQLMSATWTPVLACIAGPGAAPTSLPGSLFPLMARRSTAGGDAPWRGCVSVPSKYYTYPFLTSDSLITLLFKGGAPTIVCGVSTAVIPFSLSLHNIVPPPYECYFATYLDFPALSNPPKGDVFQKLVVDKWATSFSPIRGAIFPPFHCWSATNDSSKPFHFKVLFEGEHEHRCLFQSDCPLCSEDKVSTAPPIFDSSAEDAAAFRKGTALPAGPTTFDSFTVSDFNFRATHVDRIPDKDTTPSLSFS